ncbi:MAG TPA: fibronectin type III domain-containing protein [Dehalococcoidia bacterium]|nr:fibronectin type III domain-containing protein [Dehalococcoidia bacterium]
MKKYLLAAVSLAFLFVLLGSANAGPPSQEPGLERAITVQEAHTERLFGLPGVVGTAVGLKANGEATLRIYTESLAIPGLPSSLDGVPVEVVATGRFYAYGCTNPIDTTARCDRPVPIGVSTGHPDITAGTIGARVTNGVNVFSLSNNHVYANNNNASIGDNALQPGAYDGGSEGPDNGAVDGDEIGTLYDFQSISFNSTTNTNTMDAAIVLSSTQHLDNATLSDGYGTPSSTVLACNSTCGNLLNEPVQKSGRTTGLTLGTVAEVNVTVDVCYAGFIFCTKWARFVDQLSITPGSFSAGGDSGSLIVNQDANQPVGLLFAGSSTRTIANRIDLVLNRFGVSIDSTPPVLDTEAPAAPSNLTATAVSSSQINLSWTAASDNIGIDGYEVWRDGTYLATVSGSATSHSDTGLAANTFYSYEVRAFDAAGNYSAFSNQAGDTTDPAPSISLTATGYKVRGQQRADLEWSGATSSQVDIWRKDNGGSYQKINTVANDSSSLNTYTDPINKKGSGTYTYKVCELNSTTACSNEAVVSF